MNLVFCAIFYRKRYSLGISQFFPSILPIYLHIPVFVVRGLVLGMPQFPACPYIH